jgi:hypothetical protein
MEAPGLETLAARLLPTLDSAAHREIAGTEPVTVDGREGMRVETWDKMTHESRQSFLFLLNEENILVLWTAFGKHAEMKATFEGLADSLRFHSPATTTS